MGSAWELELVTDRRLNVRLLVIRDVDVWGGLDLRTRSGSFFSGFMWTGPSGELRCREEEGPGRSTPSAARP